MRARRLLAAAACLTVGLAGCASDAPEDAATTTTAVTDPSIAAVAGLPGADAARVDQAGTDPLDPLPEDVALPIVFVHGFAGSAQQYESQAMRFVANGYPQDRIVAYDHDGAGVDLAGYADGVDALVDRVLDEFGSGQVYLVGHSRGTSVSSLYLSDRARAAKVAKYVAIDGAPCPEVVPCLAPTQGSNPGQSHVEVAASPESFAAQYEFLIGEPPEVTEIVPQRAPVVLAGRAVDFPSNEGRAGATLDVWAVDADTGHRTGDVPHASFTLGDDGAFGPFVVEGGAPYEYVLSSDESAVQHHLYPQPALRDSSLMRLLSSGPDGPTRTNTNVGDDHTSVIAIRMREWYADDVSDVAGDQRDVLRLAVRSSAGDVPAVDVMAGVDGNGAIGLHLHDDAATPGETTLARLPYFSGQPFQDGVDVFLPADPDASGTVTVTNLPRGDESRPQTVNVANWPSRGHAVTVMFADHPVD
ncbi:MAG: alpha/beta fold hydrolase [Acidimicrobiales bacterium]|nr:alpha/beta fold hydrolase [Acidimicrobiales bacterium]